MIPTLLWGVDNQPVIKLESTDSLIENIKDSDNGPGPAQIREAKVNANKTTEISKDELLANPQLLQRAMESVLISQNIDSIKLIHPIYKKMSKADSVLINYASALIAHSEGKYREAINDYRSVLSAQPQLSAVRFNLAMALYHDRQNTGALDQFRKLNSENLPPSVAKSVNEGIAAINRQENWGFSVSGYYQHNDNINGAPSQNEMTYGSGTLTFPKAEKAHGIHIDVGASKRFNLADNFYTRLRLNANSDKYWDNHDYDSLELRAGIGLGMQSTKLTAELEPFAKRRFFGSESYSKTLGATMNLDYQVSPKWRLKNTNELGREHFYQRKHLNGNRKSNSLSVNYISNPQQSWTAGVSYFNNQARDLEDNYSTKGAFLGWGQEWPKGLSSNLRLSANKRKHEGVDFFNIQRDDQTYRANMSLWHRDWHWKGLTPRLVMSWEKTRSNHFYYDNQTDLKANIELSKQF